MVDVALFVQSIDDVGLEPVTHVIETGNTYKVRNNGFVALLFKKSGAGDATITIPTPATVGGLPVADRTITVPANTGDVTAAKFPPLVYNDAGGNLNFTTDDDTGLTCRVLALRGGAIPPWWLPFNSRSGKVPVAIFDFAGAEGGQYRVDGVNESFADLFTFTRASTATVVNSAGLLGIVVDHAPRFDHDKNGTRIGLLIEEARENVRRGSETFDDAARWDLGNVTISANAIVAPNGTMTADKLVETNDNSRHRTFAESPGSTLTAATWTASAFAKSGERNWIYIRIDTTGQFDGVYFDLSGSGAVGTAIGSGYSGGIEDYGNGWFRCSVSFTATVANYFMGFHVAESDTVDFYQGDDTKGVYGWGTQLELGALSSYIPTTTVSVTRLGEDAPVATSDWDFSATVGSLYGVVTPNHLPASELILFSLNDGTTNEVIEVYIDSSANVRFRVTDGGVDQCDIDSLVNAVADTELKIAVSWAVNDFAISVNGAAIAVDSGGTLPTVTTLDPCENGLTASLAQYNPALSGADLVARTA